MVSGILCSDKRNDCTDSMCRDFRSYHERSDADLILIDESGKILEMQSCILMEGLQRKQKLSGNLCRKENWKGGQGITMMVPFRFRNFCGYKNMIRNVFEKQKDSYQCKGLHHLSSFQKSGRRCDGMFYSRRNEFERYLVGCRDPQCSWNFNRIVSEALLSRAGGRICDARGSCLYRTFDRDKKCMQGLEMQGRRRLRVGFLM